MRRRPIVNLAVICIGIMVFPFAMSQTPGQPTLPGEPCRTAPLAEWTPQEKWVWSKVCVGEIADFNVEPGYGGDLDPNEAESWPENRVLTPQFLETILLFEPYQSAQTRRGVRIIGAWFQDEIDLTGAEFERELWLVRSRLDTGCVLKLARIGFLSFRGSTFAGTLNMVFTTVEGSFSMKGGANFQEVDLQGAKISGELSMVGSIFVGKLDMQDATVEGNFLMSDGANFQEVDLRAAKISGELFTYGSTFAGRIDLRAATVEGELSLTNAVWKPVSILDLRNAKVKRLSAHVGESNPGLTKLAGFTYEELGSPDGQKTVSDSADFIEYWLREEETHSPQAHEQFALVLKQMGFPAQAAKTLYEGKEHERIAEWERGNWEQAGWLFVLKVMIGYGYRVWYALVWFVLFVFIGFCVARKSWKKVPGLNERLGFWYSVDRLLPIVQLRKRHYEVELPERARVYFYFHTIMGYVLTTFLLAGLAGLTR